MRVVHLLDQAGWQTCPTTLALLAQTIGRLGDCEQDVLLFGNAALERAARQRGIERVVRLATPFGRAMFAWLAVRHHARRGRLADLDLGNADLLHCWSTETLTLATSLWRNVPRVLTLAVAPSPRAVRWLSILGRETSRPTVLLATTATIRRTLLTGGVPESSAHVVRPGLDLGMVDHESRTLLRRQWGLTSDRAKVIALLGDPPHATDALEPARMLLLAGDAYAPGRQPIRLLICPDQARRRAAENLLRGLGREHWIIRDRRLTEPWRALPGCDLALTMAPHGGGLSLLWAMAANVPIIAEATHAVSEIVEDRHSALLAKPGKNGLLAHRIKQLIDDDRLALRLKDAARAEVFSLFSRQHHCRCVKAVYDQLVADQPIEVPQLPLTGSLRFMGKT